MCGCWIVKVSVSDTLRELASEHHAGLTPRTSQRFKLRYLHSSLQLECRSSSKEAQSAADGSAPPPLQLWRYVKVYEYTSKPRHFH